MSEQTHGAFDGGGAAKWLLGAAIAVLLLSAGYFGWKAMAPRQENAEVAHNEPYSAEPLSAGALEPAADIAAPAPTEARTAPRRSRAAEVPEETIGVTPASATTEESATAQDSEEIVVTAPRRPIWARTPSLRTLSALYPERARERGREGEASLHCIVQAGGALDCERMSETPGGFGPAALRVARTLRHAPQLADGTDAVGSPVRLRVVFRMEEERRRRRG